MEHGKLSDGASDYQFRLAEPSDTPAIVDLCCDVGAFSEDEAVSAGNDVTDYHNFYLNRDRVLVSQGRNGKLAAFAHFSPASITHGTWFIYWIAVAKNAQGKGLGKEMIRQAEAEIRRLGGRLLLIETSTKPAFESARCLYTSMAYTLQATIPDYFARGDHKNIYWKLLQE
jgi:ribosomal protein S18 acetylase RimI-like enzyme